MRSPQSPRLEGHIPMPWRCQPPGSGKMPWTGRAAGTAWPSGCPMEAEERVGGGEARGAQGGRRALLWGCWRVSGNRQGPPISGPWSTAGGPGDLLPSPLPVRRSARRRGPRGTAGSRRTQLGKEETCTWSCSDSICRPAGQHPSVPQHCV